MFRSSKSLKIPFSSNVPNFLVRSTQNATLFRIDNTLGLGVLWKLTWLPRFAFRRISPTGFGCLASAFRILFESLRPEFEACLPRHGQMIWRRWWLGRMNLDRIDELYRRMSFARQGVLTSWRVGNSLVPRSRPFCYRPGTFLFCNTL